MNTFCHLTGVGGWGRPPCRAAIRRGGNNGADNGKNDAW